ncbi:MAG: c-type cytochrome [Acidobacteriota bacterium]
MGHRLLGAATFLLITAIGASLAAQTKGPARLGIGRPATADEIRALDIDVMPSGVGLPDGRGSVAEGAATYAAKCASCHGPKGEGGSFERLVGRDSGENFAFGRDPRLVKTIGSYWPYATTLFDYTVRTMPFAQPGTLSANEVYGLVAYLLALNKIVPDDAVMDKASLPKVVMPARGKFVPDNRTGGPKVK